MLSKQHNSSCECAMHCNGIVQVIIH